MDRVEINTFGDRIKAHLLDGDSAILVEIGAKPASDSCAVPSMLATVRGNVGTTGLHDFTSNAVSLDDAIHLARGKLRDARTAHDKAKAKTSPLAGERAVR